MLAHDGALFEAGRYFNLALVWKTCLQNPVRLGNSPGGDTCAFPFLTLDKGSLGFQVPSSVRHNIFFYPNSYDRLACP